MEVNLFYRRACHTMWATTAMHTAADLQMAVIYLLWIRQIPFLPHV